MHNTIVHQAIYLDTNQLYLVCSKIQEKIFREDLGEVGNGACPSSRPVFVGLWSAAVIHGAVYLNSPSAA